MVVAVTVMLVVQVAINQIVRVIAVWNSFVTAARTMNVVSSMARTIVTAGAIGWVRTVNRKRVLVNMIAMYVVHMTIV
jgi:hypothetical protein